MAKRKKKKRSYSIEFKQEAVRLLETRGDSTVAEVAASLKLKPSQLYEWKRALGGAIPSVGGGETVEQENERLRRELSQIRKENDTLKKSVALFVRDMKL